MTSLFAWMPLWMQFLIALGAAALGLIFLLMPFSVFGVKPRLEEVELQLSEVRAELRVLTMRLARNEPETGPSGEPVFRPPTRDTREAAASAPERPQHTTRDPMPWSSPPYEANQPRPDVRKPPADTPRHATAPASRPENRYEDQPKPDHVSQILRPTHFEPPPREAPRQAPPPAWNASPTSPTPEPRRQEPPVRQREEMSPRPDEDARRRYDDESGNRRPRSEPTLRWPPRG